MQLELEGFAGKVGAELLDKDVFEVTMFAFTKEFPNVLVAQCCEGRDLEFQEMVLRGVQVHSVDSARVSETE